MEVIYANSWYGHTNSISSMLFPFLSVWDVDIQIFMETDAYNDKVSITSVQEYKLYHWGHILFPSSSLL